MSDKDLKKLMDLANEKLEQDVTREEALRSFMDAGILNRHGEFTAPYEHLAEADRSN